jgi:hypothetical protein
MKIVLFFLKYSTISSMWITSNLWQYCIWKCITNNVWKSYLLRHSPICPDKNDPAVVTHKARPLATVTILLSFYSCNLCFNWICVRHVWCCDWHINCLHYPMMPCLTTWIQFKLFWKMDKISRAVHFLYHGRTHGLHIGKRRISFVYWLDTTLLFIRVFNGIGMDEFLQIGFFNN